MFINIKGRRIDSSMIMYYKTIDYLTSEKPSVDIIINLKNELSLHIDYEVEDIDKRDSDILKLDKLLGVQELS